MAETDNRWSPSAKRLKLGGIEIDLRYRTITHGDEIAEIHPRCFDLLLLFLRERGTLQTREAIFRKVWPGVIVEDSTLTSSIWVLRRAMGADNKHWIRTVAKQGYVFDPPAEFALVEEPSADRSDEVRAPAVGLGPSAAPDVAAPPRQPPASTPARRLWPVAIFVLLAIGLAALAMRGAFDARATRRVELVVQSSPDARSELAWPAQALDAWLEWQLNSFDGLEIVRDADACADCESLIVLLSVERLGAGTDGVWRLAVRFRGEGVPADILREATDEHLIGTLDDVARSTIAALVSEAKHEGLPHFRLDRPAARLWVQALDAEREQRWGTAAELHAQVLDRSPEFGYARVQLARSLSEARQLSQAVAATDKLAAWIDALPYALKRPLAAHLLFVKQDYAGAAEAYATLAQASGVPRADYRIAEARSLRLDGRTLDAADRLKGDVPRSRRIALRWLMERAETEMANRDVARVLDSVADASRIAEDFDQPQSLAYATLLRAEAQSSLAKPLQAHEIEQAAVTLEKGGNLLEAVRARAYEALLSATPAGPGKATDAYIANARMAGNGNLEIDALRRIAQFHLRNGDAAAAHTAYVQAGEVAKSTIGSRRDRQLVDLDLLQDDTLRLAFPSIDQRLASLRAQPLQGRVAVLAGQHAARMAYWRGDFAASLAILEETVARHGATATGNLAQVTSTLGCLRAGVHMARGETALARNAGADCRASGMPLNRRLADITDAELAIYSGDPGLARRLVEPMLAELGQERNQIFRWANIQEVAPLVARYGDAAVAARMVDGALPGVTEAGYTSFEADMRITRAEIALAQSETERAAKELERAEAIVPRDYWYDMRRIRTARVALTSRTDAAAAAAEAARLHADAVALGDVLAELRVHSLLAPAQLDALCTRERHQQLLATSGMRGASDLWLLGSNPVLLNTTKRP